MWRSAIKIIDGIVRDLRDPEHPSLRWKVVCWNAASEDKNREPLDHNKLPRSGNYVAYDTFRQSLRRGELAFLLEVAYEDRRRGLDVPHVTEGLVQGTWRQAGKVPRDVYEYVLRSQDAIAAIARLPSAATYWSKHHDRAIADLLRMHDYQETAFRMRRKYRVRITVGMLKGRCHRYNVR